MKKQKTIFDELVAAKEKEEKARLARISIEEKIAAELGEGTTKIDGYKITVKKPITYKLDAEMYLALNIPADYSIERIKYEVDKKKFDCLKMESVTDTVAKTFYKKISDCIEMKEGKTSITIEKEESK